MPIRNEADFIERRLGAVLAQDYPADYIEILIADGLSTDKTRQIINSLAKSTTIPIHIINNLGQIVPSGFNTALKQAQGDIIVRVDGHTVMNRTMCNK